MDQIMIAFIVLIISVFISTTLNNKALLRLDAEKKLLFIELFTKNRTWNYLIILGILILYFLTLKYKWIAVNTNIILFVVSFIGYLIFKTYNTLKLLKNHDFPVDFIKSYKLITLVRIIGIILFSLVILLKN
jgi:hypothetical protein